MVLLLVCDCSSAGLFAAGFVLCFYYTPRHLYAQGKGRENLNLIYRKTIFSLVEQRITMPGFIPTHIMPPDLRLPTGCAQG